MKQPEDTRTAELPGLSHLETGNPEADRPRCTDDGQGGLTRVTLYCRGCKHTARQYLQPGQGSPMCPRCACWWMAITEELPEAAKGRGRKPGQRVGAYKGAVKIGCDNHRDRAATGKSQAEFAALCGISERTLRTWERGEPVSTATEHAIRSKLDLLTPRHRQQPRPVKFRCPLTGSTWSGRGLMPVWLRVALQAKGRRLDDFATGA